MCSSQSEANLCLPRLHPQRVFEAIREFTETECHQLSFLWTRLSETASSIVAEAILSFERTPFTIGECLLHFCFHGFRLIFVVMVVVLFVHICLCALMSPFTRCRKPATNDRRRKRRNVSPLK